MKIVVFNATNATEVIAGYRVLPRECINAISKLRALWNSTLRTHRISGTEYTPFSITFVWLVEAKLARMHQIRLKAVLAATLDSEKHYALQECSVEDGQVPIEACVMSRLTFDPLKLENVPALLEDLFYATPLEKETDYLTELRFTIG